MRIQSCVYIIAIVIAVTGCSSNTINTQHRAPTVHNVALQSSTGVTTEVSFLQGKTTKAIILIPEWVLPKESWNQFAAVLNKSGFSVLSMEGHDIATATSFLTEKGMEEINLLGAGLGGEVILDTLQNPVDSRIKRVVVISPYEAIPVKNKRVKKLFVMSEDDWQVPADRVVAAYKKSTEPKRLKLFSGSAHGQSFFKGKHSEELVALLLQYLKS